MVRAYQEEAWTHTSATMAMTRNVWTKSPVPLDYFNPFKKSRRRQTVEDVDAKDSVKILQSVWVPKDGKVMRVPAARPAGEYGVT